MNSGVKVDVLSTKRKKQQAAEVHSQNASSIRPECLSQSQQLEDCIRACRNGEITTRSGK